MKDREIQILLKLRDEFSGVMDDVEKNTANATGKMSKMFKVGLVGAIGTVGGALGKLTFDALAVSSDANKALFDFQAQLGVTEEEAQALADVAVGVWGNNFGKSVEETSESISLLSRNMKHLGDDKDVLQEATQDAYRLQDAFGIDFAESTTAANALMKEFGLNSNQAFDFVTTGVRKGLNANGDFLDSIKEYAPQFREGNATADEFFSIMETGFQDGVLGTDKVSDAFKQLRIEMIDVPDGGKLAEPLRELGLNGEQMANDLATGGKSITQIYGDIEKALDGVDDEAKRATLSQKIFGTMGEDAANLLKLGLDDSATSLEDMAGATDDLDVQYQDFGTRMQGLWRDIVLEVEPFASKLLDLAQEIIPVLIEAIDGIVQGLKGVMESEFFQRAVELFDELAAQVGEIIGEFVAFLVENWDQIQEAVVKVIEFLTPFLEKAMRFFGSLFEELVDIVKGVFKIIEGIIKTVISVITGDFEGLKDGLGRIWQGIKSIIEGVLGGIKASVEFVVNIIVDIVEKIFNEGKSIVEGIWNGIKDAIEGAINAAKQVVEDVVGAITGILETPINLLERIFGLGGDDSKWSKIREEAKKTSAAMSQANIDQGRFTGQVQGNQLLYTAKFSKGADFIVPDGYPNDSFPMLVESGERVQVTPANQVTNTTDNSRNIQQVNIYTNEGFQSFLEQLNF